MDYLLSFSSSPSLAIPSNSEPISSSSIFSSSSSPPTIRSGLGLKEVGSYDFLFKLLSDYLSEILINFEI